MIDAGGRGTEAGAACAAHGLTRLRGGGNVDVGHGLAKQRVADRAADDARFLAIGGKSGKQRLELFVGQPFRI